MAATKPVQKKADQDPAAEIAAILATSLAKFKETLGEKKFEKRVRKAAKLFTQGAKNAEKKNKVKKVIPAVKPAKKTATVKVKAAKAAPAKKTSKSIKSAKKTT